MAQRAFIMSSSLRKRGNFYILYQSFVYSAEESGNKVAEIFINNKKAIEYVHTMTSIIMHAIRKMILKKQLMKYLKVM